MDTLKQWIEYEAEGEPIEAVVFDQVGSSYPYKEELWPKLPKGQLLTWEEAQPWLSIEFHSDYGSVNCPALVAWTKSWVISISQYDGSTSPFRIPRNPTAHMPEMPGG